MANFSWHPSLALRLSLSLSCVITFFWLLSIVGAIMLDLSLARKTLLSRLDLVATETANGLEEKLQRVEHDVRTLRKNWHNMPNDFDENTLKNRFINARYFATGHTPPDTTIEIQRALSFVEAFGSGGIGDLVETFVVLNGGVVISCPSTDKQCRETPNHLAQLKNLHHSEQREGIIWSKPYRGYNGEWNVMAAQKDNQRGGLVGITLRLPVSFSQTSFACMKAGELVWTGANGEPFTPFPDWDSGPSPTCYWGFSSLMSDVHVIKKQIKTVGWYLNLVTPARLITESAFYPLNRYLIVASLLLVLLVSLLYLSLRHTLGKTLGVMLNTLAPKASVAELAPLPVKGYDELAKIANAYNRLLNELKGQYAELENKVEERTHELNEARQRAETANANKSEQINNISHEIRTPLNGVVGALSLLNNTLFDAEQHSLIHIALKCSDHLLEIINNLLDFSRIESGQMEFIPTELEPLAIIEQALLTMQLPALNKHLTLTCEIAANFPSKILTDRLRLRQILINLLGNAVKFTPAGRVQLFAWSEDDKICFRVHDDGPGIPPQHSESIFTAFRQLDSHVAGSGLGLPIARSLSQLLGGDLYLEPVAQGASFRLDLPLQGALQPEFKHRGPIVAPLRLHKQLRSWGYQPEPGDNPDLAAPELSYLPDLLRHRLNDQKARPRGNAQVTSSSAWLLNVLVVDDVDTNRDIIVRMLHQQGHKAYTASSGKEALEQGMHHIFDLVLMDIRMPGLSGTETLALWRDEGNEILDHHCPIFAVTANTQPSERERLQSFGFNEFLTKPVTPQMLYIALENAADLQLERGVELDLNIGNLQPLIAKGQKQLLRLKTDLAFQVQRLVEALRENNHSKSLDHLHSLKGLAGQSGMDLVWEAAEQYENLLHRGQPLPEDAIPTLQSLITIELEG